MIPGQPAQQWPVPVSPVPAAVNIKPVDGVGPNGPVRLVVVEVYTAAGAAFAFLDPDQAERMFSDAVRIAAGQRAGLTVPINGIIRPTGHG